MTLFVVFGYTDDYDYRDAFIVGAYSTRELAEQAKSRSDEWSAEIAEVNLDELPPVERDQRLAKHDMWFADHLRELGKTEAEIATALSAAKASRSGA
jgi:hypothetical protein